MYIVQFIIQVPPLVVVVFILLLLLLLSLVNDVVFPHSHQHTYMSLHYKEHTPVRIFTFIDFPRPYFSMEQHIEDHYLLHLFKQEHSRQKWYTRRCMYTVKHGIVKAYQS